MEAHHPLSASPLRAERLAAAARSDSAAALVSALAWAFILLSAFAMVVCVTESIVVAVMFPSGTQALARADHFGDFGQFVLGHLQALLLTLLAIFAVSLVAAIGLLRRANWARLAFIGLMLFGIYWNLGGGIVVWYFLSPTSDAEAPAPLPGAQWHTLRNMAVAFDLVLSVAAIVFFGWIIQRLRSAPVRREFRIADRLRLHASPPAA